MNPAAALLLSAASGVAGPVDPGQIAPPQVGPSAGIEQIPVTHAGTVAAMPPRAATTPSRAEQVSNPQPAPVSAQEPLLRPDDMAADVALYRKVQSAWMQIRASGAHPTQDALTQLVGPEALSAFLARFPGAEAVFSGQTEQWPLPPVEPRSE
ncbi:MAG: hypothetical protein IPN84_10200 [Sphingomonadales bacterium]|nr:hypothetical protein [Sphingomonadales bacterium]